MSANPVRPRDLKLETETKDSVTTIRATGRIILETSAALENTLRDVMAQGKRVVLDLSNVDYIDSAGLGVLVSVYMHAGRIKCSLEIANPKDRIRDLFTRSGLASVFKGRSFDVMWDAWSHTGSD